MSRKAMTFAAAHAVSHSARSSKAASFALIEAVRFFAYRFFYYYFYGSRTGRIWQSGYGITAGF